MGELKVESQTIANENILLLWRGGKKENTEIMSLLSYFLCWE